MSRPRIRTIKPEAWQDEKIGSLSRDARLLWVALITLADDHGRFRNRPNLILGHGFPYDDDAPRKLAGWMRELTESRLVITYTSAGHNYGWLPKWSAHQRVNRPADSELPEPSVNGHGTFTEQSLNGA